jgi:hypothetical protein
MSIEYIIVIVLSLIVFLAVFLIFKPIHGFYSIIAVRIILEAYVIKSYPEYSTYILGSFSIALMIIACLIFFAKDQFEIFVKPINFFYLFIFCSSLSIGYSGNIINAIAAILKYISLAVLFIIAYNLPSNLSEINTSLKLLIMTAILPLSLGYWQIFTNQGLHYSNFWGQSYHAIFSTFAHPNQYAFFLGTIAIALILKIQERRPKAIYIFFIGNVLISIIFTYSRAVWLCLLICVGIASLIYKKLRLPLAVFGLLIFIFMASIIMGGLEDIVHKRKGQSNSLDFRINISKQLAENAFPRKPLLGFGPGTSPNIVGKYTQYPPIVPHNDYMRVLIEGGAVSFMVLLSFFSYNFIHLIGKQKNLQEKLYKKGLLILLTYFTVIIIATNHLGNVSTSGIWFCLYGILYKGYSLSKDKNGLYFR